MHLNRGDGGIFDNVIMLPFVSSQLEHAEANGNYAKSQSYDGMSADPASLQGRFGPRGWRKNLQS
jgi:hypothetical protein